MKTLLFIFILWSVAFSTPNCFDEYVSLAKKIERKYIRAQAEFKGTQAEHYVYEFSPASMFPFFCIPQKEKYPDVSKYQPVYLCSFTTNVLIRTDTLKNDHVIITILNYIQQGKARPYARTYTAYFFIKNRLLDEWVVENKSIEVTFIWDQNLQQYILR